MRQEKSKKNMAAVLFGPKDMRSVQKEIPKGSNVEVLIKVEACAICGSDIKMFNKPWGPHPPFHRRLGRRPIYHQDAACHPYRTCQLPNGLPLL